MDVFKLPDGRGLHYSEYGNPQGFPLLFCHGTPGARFQVTDEMARQANKMGMRVIVPERPGYGHSDPMPGRSLLDWTRDATMLMDALNIERFWIVGYSMGGVYAWACAAAQPERVMGVSLVGGLAPEVFDPEVAACLSPALNAIFAMARDNPEGLSGALSGMLPDGDTLFAALTDGLPASDIACLADPQVESAFRRDCAETLRQGHGAIADDYILLVNDWDFQNMAIQCPVHIWSGSDDRVSSPAMVRCICAHLPDAKVHDISGVGHLCLFSHWWEILVGIRASAD